MAGHGRRSACGLSGFPNIKVKILGGVPDNVKPWIGSNWSILPLSMMGYRSSSAELDSACSSIADVRFEAFGISIAEAMASGAVTVLDRSFESSSRTVQSIASRGTSW